MTGKAKVAVDARWMLGNVRGMGRYAWQLISPVVASTIAMVPRGFTVEGMDYKSRGNSFFPWWEQIELPRLVATIEHKPIMLCPYNTGPIFKRKDGKLVLVVHDLIFMKSRREVPWGGSIYQVLGRIYRRLVVPYAVRNASVILTVSEYTKREICERYEISPNLIEVIPNSLDESWFEIEVPSLMQRSNYALTVTGEASSKNLSKLLIAFSKALPYLEPDFSLKVVGVKEIHHHKFKTQCKALGILENVVFYNFVTDDELKSLYRNARIFVLPSLLEGFGIPLLEAMASGVPIACSNRGSLPEVVRDGALLFDPESDDSICQAIVSLTTNSSMAAELVEKSRRLVETYRLSNIAPRFRRFWERLDVAC